MTLQEKIAFALSRLGLIGAIGGLTIAVGVGFTYPHPPQSSHDKEVERYHVRLKEWHEKYDTWLAYSIMTVVSSLIPLAIGVKMSEYYDRARELSEPNSIPDSPVFVPRQGYFTPQNVPETQPQQKSQGQNVYETIKTKMQQEHPNYSETQIEALVDIAKRFKNLEF